MEKLQLTEGAYLNRAAVLLFHPDPEKFIPGGFVKIGFFRSESDLAYHDTLCGDLFVLAARTIDVLQTKYLKAAIGYRGIQRIERFPVPHSALREAILNALVHRDYAVPAPVQIRVYSNRLTIWNPCILPEGWTLKKLLGPHSSTPFNPSSANAFFSCGEIETWGRGIQRILTACREEGTPKPRFTLEPTGIWVEFPFAPAYVQAVKESETNELSSNKELSRPESNVAILIIRSLATGPLAKMEIARAIGHQSVSGELKKQILWLLAHELIERILHEKPNSRLQKYRLPPPRPHRPRNFDSKVVNHAHARSPRSYRRLALPFPDTPAQGRRPPASR